MTFSKLPNIDLISSVCHGDSASCPPNRRIALEGFEAEQVKEAQQNAPRK